MLANRVALDACVTLEEVLAAASARCASLVPETSGYLTLAVGDATSRLPLRIDERAVLLTTEGTVTLMRRGEVIPAPESARQLREVLRRLLSVSSGTMPGLAAVARPRASTDRGADAVMEELEAALIPVNRTAAQRALARLAREALRAKESGRLRRALRTVAKAYAPPPPASPPQAAPPPTPIEADGHALEAEEHSAADGDGAAAEVLEALLFSQLSPEPPALEATLNPTPTTVGMTWFDVTDADPLDPPQGVEGPAMLATSVDRTPAFTSSVEQREAPHVTPCAPSYTLARRVLVSSAVDLPPEPWTAEPETPAAPWIRETIPWPMGLAMPLEQPPAPDAPVGEPSAPGAPLTACAPPPADNETDARAQEPVATAAPEALIAAPVHVEAATPGPPPAEAVTAASLPLAAPDARLDPIETRAVPSLPLAVPPLAVPIVDDMAALFEASTPPPAGSPIEAILRSAAQKASSGSGAPETITAYSRADELIARFIARGEAEASRGAARTLKALAGLDLTPSPCAAGGASAGAREQGTPRRASPRPPGATDRERDVTPWPPSDLSPGVPLVPGAPRARQRNPALWIAVLAIALLCAAGAGIAWTLHPYLLAALTVLWPALSTPPG